MSSRIRVVLLLAATLSSACELVAGINDRKASTAGPPAYDAGSSTGGKPGIDAGSSAGGKPGTDAGLSTGGNPGTDGPLATGGSGGSGAAGAGGSDARVAGGGAGGGLASGGASGPGGVQTTGGTLGSGGIFATGGAISPLDAAGTGGKPANGGTTGAGGITGAGGATGLGGTRADAAPDLPVDAPPNLLPDAPPDLPPDAAPDAAPDSPPDVPLDLPVDTACPAVGVLGTGNGLKGEYFVTSTLTGTALTRIDATINFNWPGAPDLGVPADGFSVRWTGQVQPRFSGEYTFITSSDDGIRLWVDGTLIIDDWSTHSVTEDTGVISLTAGQMYDIKIEFFEATGAAIAQLSWMSPCQAREVVPQSQLYAPPAVCAAPNIGTGTGLQGNYFDNPDFTNKRLSRIDPTVSFVWATGSSPSTSIAPDTYSIRWTGQVQAKYSGWTTFFLVSDDGVRFFVDDALVIDDWSPPHGATQDVATLDLVAGQQYNLRLDYYDGVGGGQVQLLWGSECQSQEIIPTTQLYQTYTGVVCDEPVAAGGTGLRGDYYDNNDFTNFVLSHDAEVVDFNWADGSPDPLIGADTFSVRWTGQVQPQLTGVTTFSVVSDDAARLWVDGQLIIDDWGGHSAAEASGTATLTAGQRYDIRLDYREDTGAASVTLYWTNPCQAKAVIPASQLFPAPPADAGVLLDAN